MALGSPPDDERTALQFLERFLPADELGHLVFSLALLKLLDSLGELGQLVNLAVEDDHSDRRTLEAVLPGVAERCDILLGP
jgi:hypothetical protein